MPSITCSNHYWLLIGNAPQGPFDVAAIQAKLSIGEINSQTPACPLGSQTWSPLARFLSFDSNQSLQLRVNQVEPPQAMPQPRLAPQKEISPPIPPTRPKSRSLMVGGICACLVGVGAVVGILLWPSGYNLANRYVPKGTITREEIRSTMTGGTITWVIADQVVTGLVDIDTNEVIEKEVLQVTGREPSKFRISFLSDITRVTITFPNQPAKVETIPEVFHGHTILVEKVSGLWKQSLLGGNPNPAQARALQVEWTPDNVYPDRRLTIGESWTVTGPALRKLAGNNDCLSFQGSAMFTLQEVVTRNAEKYALIHAQLEVKFSTLDGDNQEASVEMALSGHVYRSLSSFTDKVELTGQMKYTGAVVTRGQIVRGSMNGPVTVRSTELRK